MPAASDFNRKMTEGADAIYGLTSVFALAPYVVFRNRFGVNGLQGIWKTFVVMCLFSGYSPAMAELLPFWLAMAVYRKVTYASAELSDHPGEFWPKRLLFLDLLPWQAAHFFEPFFYMILGSMLADYDRVLGGFVVYSGLAVLVLHIFQAAAWNRMEIQLSDMRKDLNRRRF